MQIRPPRVFPPLVYAAAFLVGVALQRLLPLSVLPEGLHVIPATFLSLGGLALFLAALRALRKAGASPNPFAVPATLVTDGPYLRSRNPMYFAYLWLYLGLAFWIHSLWPLLLLPVVVVAMNRLVIGPEEETLEARFGNAWRAYKARTRRWA